MVNPCKIEKYYVTKWKIEFNSIVIMKELD